MKYLNIACGGRYHKDWTNLDFHSDSRLIQKVNLLNGLPFQENLFDVVYTSHFIEHLSHSQACFILGEAKRVLKPGCILRIVVPDLENICKEYLKVLEDIHLGNNATQKYTWIQVELLDQLVRIETEGKMGKIYSETVKTNNKLLSDYILHRTGHELVAKNNTGIEKKIITLNKIRNKILYFYLKFIRLLVPKNLRDLIFIKTSVGERHQWMYDKYSLTLLLNELGFRNIQVKTYDTSNIKCFNDFFLDIKEDGTPYKGVGSLYIEAFK